MSPPRCNSFKSKVLVGKETMKLRLFRKSLIILLVIIVAILVSSCDRSEAEIRSGGLVIKISPPSGWVIRHQTSGETVIASREADTTAQIPTGPRLKVQAIETALLRPADLYKKVRPSSSASVTETLEEPAQSKLGTADGMAYTIKEMESGQLLIRRQIAVNAGQGRVITILLEAPEDQWQQTKSELEKTAQTLKFVPA